MIHASPSSCELCGRSGLIVAGSLGVCLECLRGKARAALAVVRRRTGRSRPSAGVDVRPASTVPAAVRAADGPGDGLIAVGFYDEHPANCIACWQCPGTTGCGFPQFAVTPGMEVGYRNLAVFSAGCTFDCPFCQDWIHGPMLAARAPVFSDDEILSWVDERTTCVSFCGGTPDVQLRAVTRIARKMREQFAGRVMRICAETNLTAPWRELEPFARLVFESGGGLNIGLKAGSEVVHRALTGASLRQVWRNIERLHAHFGPGDHVPFIRPSLLVVPGYIDREEVRLVAERLVGIDPRISLRLIAFLPRHRMMDVPAADGEMLAQLAGEAVRTGLASVYPHTSSV